ncbi:MAG: amidohydrolase family protein [Chitinophagaceae bacterium]
MGLMKFYPDRVFDGYRFREPGMVLVTDETGLVHDIIPDGEAGEDLLPLRGILTPGFINCHCHLELSHLKNVIPPHTGLVEFLCSVVTKREFPPEKIAEEIILAEKELFDNGVVAVGDIGNTADTATVKKGSRIRWQNFVEVLGFTDEKATENFAHYQAVANSLEAALANAPVLHRTSLVPHAPYSISPKTFDLIN